MATSTPFLAESLKGFIKEFLSFYVCQGLQGQAPAKAGIKVIKGIKHLSPLHSFYSCPVVASVRPAERPP